MITGGFFMFGTTKLSEIRKRLEEAKASGGRIPNAKRDGEGARIMEELNQFIQRARKELRRIRRANVKK
jgi:hypothetical protein